jgi:predicted NBD/HSP70 family sugar kinase
MKVSVLGIDLGKNACSIVGFDETGAVVLRRRAKRETLTGLAAKAPDFWCAFKDGEEGVIGDEPRNTR